MVISAAKLMSNTLSKPSARSAVTILPSTLVPIALPNSSPSAARTAGRRADHHDLPGIAEEGFHFFDLALFIERADRADVDALAAGHAPGVFQPVLKRHVDIGGKSAFVRADHPHFLHVLADRNAAAAENTLVVVADQPIRRGIRLKFVRRALESSRVAAYSFARFCSSQLVLRMQERHFFW